MKKRFLPFGFFAMLILGLIVLFLLPSVKQVETTENAKSGAQTIAGAKAYLASIRNNQHTGLLNPKDVINARQQLKANNNKSGNANELLWTEMGPDNMGGRTRAVIFDNRDTEAKTIYAGSVTGGIFKTTNLASTWEKVNLSSGTANLNVTSMVQTSDGIIYAATGEGLSSENYTATGDLGYDGGFVGTGIFKSNEDDNFFLVDSTSPKFDEGFAYINELALDTENNRLFAATQTGLKYANFPNLDNWSDSAKYQVDSLIIDREIIMDSTIVCDSFEILENGGFIAYGNEGWQINRIKNDTTNIEEVYKDFELFETQGNCYDVKVSPDGYIIAMFNDKVFVSEDGSTEHFINRSIYPKNAESIRKDSINWSVQITIKDKNGSILLDSLKEITEIYDWHIDYYEEAESSVFDEFPHSSNAGRTEFAIAPSSPNMIYAMASARSDKSLLGVYLSEDSGQSWRVIAPGGSSSLNILGATYNETQFYYQGDFCNTISVYPNDSSKILVGGINLWLGKKVNPTGPYSWSRKSESDATSLPFGIFDPLYMHMDHHIYTFRPGYGNKFVAGTDGGIFQGTISGDELQFLASNKNYNCTQFYTLDISFVDDIILGGTQDNGPVMISGLQGGDVWHEANFPAIFPTGTDGGSVAMSNLFSSGPGVDDYVLPTSYYSRTEAPEGDPLIDRMRRSETLGTDFAVDFLAGITDDNFISPMLLWECYDNENSRDSVKFTADTNYLAGDNVILRSNMIQHPFNYTLPVDLEKTDTLMVKDIFSNKLFIATTDAIYMSIDSYDFTGAPSWWEISADNKAGFEGIPLSMAVSDDGNQLYVGSQEGRLFRISNIALAYNEERADVGSAGCIIATHELNLEGNTQTVTSLAVDPADANKLLVTLGNYGNTNYVYYSNNALADEPVFNSVQVSVLSGDTLTQVPVYASIFEMDPATNQVIIGTEVGLFACDDIDNPEWYKTGGDAVGEIPIMAIKQQTKYKGSFTITFYDPVTNAPSYEMYPKIMNFGDVYIATHGRGIFKSELNYVGVEENELVDNNMDQNEFEFSIYPNPAVDDVTLSLNLNETSDAHLYIFDLSGKLAFSMDLGHVSDGSISIPLNLSSLKQGSYVVQVIAGANKATSKIIINK